MGTNAVFHSTNSIICFITTWKFYCNRPVIYCQMSGRYTPVTMGRYSSGSYLIAKIGKLSGDYEPGEIQPKLSSC